MSINADKIKGRRAQRLARGQGWRCSRRLQGTAKKRGRGEGKPGQQASGANKKTRAAPTHLLLAADDRRDLRLAVGVGRRDDARGARLLRRLRHRRRHALLRRGHRQRLERHRVAERAGAERAGAGHLVDRRAVLARLRLHHGLRGGGAGGGEDAERRDRWCVVRRGGDGVEERGGGEGRAKVQGSVVVGGGGGGSKGSFPSEAAMTDRPARRARAANERCRRFRRPISI